MPTKTSTLPNGKRVKLGNGSEGTIVRKEEREGFHGYIVKITRSLDKSQIGTTVGATISGMRVAQLTTPAVTTTPNVIIPSVVDVGGKDDPKEVVEKIKKLEEQKVRDTQQELQNAQKQITMMQAIAQTTPPIPQQQQELEKNLNQQEQNEEQEVDEQQQLNLQNQVMQQQQQQTQQMNMGQQQLLQKQSFTQLARPERADVAIKLGDTSVLCDVAATAKQQVTGLQAYESLPKDRGLWFPMYVRRAASFHMGNVCFPIDIVFVDNDKIAKIVSNIRPRQMGSWSAQCTDVVEVNGGWCNENRVHVGCRVQTPTCDKTASRSSIERAINTSWSGPQKARIKSDKNSGMSYDQLRTITEAATTEDPILQQIETLIPELKKTAQEDYKVKPITYREQPGEVDRRNPTERFRDHDLPPVSSPMGEDAPSSAIADPLNSGVSSYDRSHWKMQLGFDPLTQPDTGKSQLEKIQTGRGPTEGEQVVRPASRQAQIPVNTPNSFVGINTEKLAKSSLQLYTKNPPDWGETSDPRGYDKMAIINDEIISNWLSKLGFDEKNDAKLRSTMFTEEYKRMLGDSLVTARLVSDFDMLGSDLLLYRRDQ